MRTDAAEESTAIIMRAWNVMAEASPSLETRRGDLVDVSWMGLACPFFNLAATARQPTSVEAFRTAIAATALWAGERRLPWLFALCHDLVSGFLEDCDRELKHLGFAPMMPLTGMEATELLPPARSGRAMEFVTERDSSIGDTVIRLNEATYQLKFGEPGSLPLEHPGWWAPPSRMATVIAHDGQPVSSAVVLDAADTRYVALVATLPGGAEKGLCRGRDARCARSIRSSGRTRDTTLL